MGARYLASRVLLESIHKARQRQIDKWGRYKDMPPQTWLMILGEEFGEACSAAHDTIYGGKHDGELEAELIQVAAVAIAWLEEMQLGMSLPNPQAEHHAEVQK